MVLLSFATYLVRKKYDDKGKSSPTFWIREKFSRTEMCLKLFC